MEEGSDNIEKEGETAKDNKKHVESKKLEGIIFFTHICYSVWGIRFVYYCFDTSPLEGDTKNEKMEEGSDNIEKESKTEKEKPVESKKIQGTIFCTHYF